MFRKNLAIAALIGTLAGGIAEAESKLAAFDVAEDPTRFSFAPQPVHENGMPAHGNAFVTRGYIYPAGTVSGAETAVNEDGSPKFPDQVLGTWSCDGWFVDEGANATTGVWLISRQVFDFGDGNIIVTQGTELVDAGVANARAITGGTGSYADVDGTMLQTLLGFTEAMGANSSFRIVANEKHAAAQ